MERLIFLFMRLRSKWFPTKEDLAWKKWVDLRPRETRDLVKLLSEQVNDNFKRRALFLLFAPSSAVNPLYWKGGIGKFYHRVDVLNNLNPELLTYVAELIKQFVTALSPLHCDRPGYIAGGSGGITVYMSIPGKYHDALSFYNRCILDLLKKLPTEQAGEIFPLYSLNDISAFWNPDDVSGYNPFRNLMYSEEIDEKWKRAADKKMREIICAEVAEKAVPREDWENALRCYSYFIHIQFYDLRYSQELFREQAQFLVENLQPNTHMIENRRVMDFFNLLADVSQKGLRHRIARHVVLEMSEGLGRFSIYTPKTRQAADQMLGEFADDHELTEKVRELIAEGEKREAANAAHRTKEKETEESIPAAMR